MEHKTTGIQDAITAAGGQVKLAEALGVSQQNVSLWLRQGYVSNGHIVAVETLFGIPRSRLINPRIANLVEFPGEGDGV